MRNKITYILLIFFSFFKLIIAQNDSSSVLSFDKYMKIVKSYHPIAKQALLAINAADANLLKAKGGFDPKLYYNFDQKSFDDKNYWTLSNGGMYIPTWFGVELKGGLEQNNGVYLNPEEIVPSPGLIYTHISIPIAQNLFIDDRRATLKEAKIMQQASVFEKNQFLNEIMFKAGKAYWDWYLSYNNLLVFKNAVEVAQIRLNAVKQSATLGDRPNIDTLEASIQVQDRLVNYQQAQLEYVSKSFVLSNFLWTEKEEPLQINNKTIPVTANSIYENEPYINNNVLKIDSLLNQHPVLKLYEYKLAELDVEKRYKQERLKPILNVNYNPLFENTNTGINANAFSNNYKWGVNFEFPILIRKQRGDLQLTKIKILETQFDQTNKKNEIKNKINANINEFKISKDQINLFSKTVNDYENLWKAEKTLFETGESSLFMVNSREMAFISAQLKLNEIINKNRKAALEAEFSFGQLNNLY